MTCYDLDVSKDAETDYTRTYEWDIEKTVDPFEQLQAVGPVVGLGDLGALGTEHAREGPTRLAVVVERTLHARRFRS